MGIQNQNNATASSMSQRLNVGMTMDAVSICAQVEMTVGLVMVKVKDKAGWRQRAMSRWGMKEVARLGRQVQMAGAPSLAQRGTSTNPC